MKVKIFHSNMNGDVLPLDEWEDEAVSLEDTLNDFMKDKKIYHVVDATNGLMIFYEVKI